MKSWISFKYPSAQECSFSGTKSVMGGQNEKCLPKSMKKCPDRFESITNRKLRLFYTEVLSQLFFNSKRKYIFAMSKKNVSVILDFGKVFYSKSYKTLTDITPLKGYVLF